jgi:peptide/nickel transport system permease protein
MAVLARLGLRLLQIIPTVALVAVLTFVLMRLLPGDPAIQLLGDRATDANIARLRHDMGFDRSVAVQFWTYLLYVATLRLGDSITLHVPVTQLIVERMPTTLLLTAMAAVLALLIAVPLAFVAALREGGAVDIAIRMIGQVGLSMPVFYLGLILLITLAAGLGLFPVGGIGNSFAEDLYYLLRRGWPWRSVWPWC